MTCIFVTGKPRQKKAVGKKVSYPQEKPADVNVPVINEEPRQEEGEADTEVKLITGLGSEEEFEGIAGQSPSPSSPVLQEDASSPLECQPISEDAGLASGFHTSPTNEMFRVLQPVDPATKRAQTDAALNSEVPEVRTVIFRPRYAFRNCSPGTGGHDGMVPVHTSLSHIVSS